jgi:hypothetical protein
MERPRKLGTKGLLRLVGALVAVVLSPGVATPQQSRFTGLGEFLPLAPIGLPLPTIGLPLPTIGLPLSPIGLPLPPLGLPPRLDEQNNRTPRKRVPERRPKSRSHSRRPSVVYVVPPYGWGGWQLGAGAPTSDVPGVVVNPAQDSRAGALQLDVQPAASFQLYVDNYFVGTSNDVGNTLELEAGPHRVEIRAAGFKPHIFDTRVTAGRTMTYQAELEPLVTEQAPAAEPDSAAANPPPTEAARKPTTIYFIPGCYLGNLPPEQLKLPAGCDLSLLQTHKP